MDFEWSEPKRRANLEKHGIDFADAAELFMGIAIVKEDKRRDYGERRFQAVGVVQARVLVAAFTRRGEMIRMISLRKANAREQKQFFQALEDRLEAGG